MALIANNERWNNTNNHVDSVVYETLKFHLNSLSGLEYHCLDQNKFNNLSHDFLSNVNKAKYHCLYLKLVVDFVLYL